MNLHIGLSSKFMGGSGDGSDPMCRRTPPEAKTAQVVDATLCARNSRETLKHPAPPTPPTPSLGVAGARGESKKGHITTII